MTTPRRFPCEVVRVTDHGERVYTVALAADRPVPVFRPGQFLHLALDEYNPSDFWPDSRVFSIASSPAERQRVRIVYSVKGVYTTRMERELCVGKRVWVKMPYGDFIVDGSRDAVLIAGGTGITAFQAFIEGLPANHPRRVCLLYGARNERLLLGREAIEDKRRHVAALRAVYFAEDAPAGGPERGGVPHAGRVRLDALDDCGAGALTVYYLAGPPGMMRTLREELLGRGIGRDCIREDAWE